MKRSRWLSLGLLGIGLLLLGLSGAYYGYTFFATRNLDRLVYHADAANEPADTLTLSDLQALGRDAGEAAPKASPTPVRDIEAPETPTATAPSPGEPPPGEQTLYPGALIPARQWADPRGTVELGQLSLLAGFVPVASGQAALASAAPRAGRLYIPAVNIDATVEELGILDLEDSRRYATPKFTVGHIPVTPNPGEHGNGWYFGHLESPIQNEGNVFSRLPKIPGLLQAGEDVYVVLETAERQYLYQVTDTEVVHQDDLSLYEAGGAQVTLVTCVPRLKYDHRLLVTAKLVGTSGVAQAEG